MKTTETLTNLERLLPGLLKVAEALGDCPAGEELAAAVRLIQSLLVDGIEIDSWNGPTEDLDQVDLEPKYSGIWINLDFHSYGLFKIMARVEEDGCVHIETWRIE